MNLNEFIQSLEGNFPPSGISLALQALWTERKGDWHQAHSLADQEDENGGAWVHAYLHRVEGDQFNAGYWYRRAEKPFFTGSLEEEWEYIVQKLLEE